ncbi:hypothetical protein E1287_42075 [Actinomadura sp. KC06]|uniref:hypothetical protein n=1 Tax=Actinomadura sp. KC06 TaxID=2530369 RepID=UPI001052FD3A|nr:hypothetical protein [Actinomadura sp. KC06]TDD15632.1 hypothetical protein E1287_42075 [Actinomadura sp. KC06]
MKQAVRPTEGTAVPPGVSKVPRISVAWRPSWSRLSVTRALLGFTSEQRLTRHAPARLRRVHDAAFWDGFAWLKMPVEDAQRLVTLTLPYSVRS